MTAPIVELEEVGVRLGERALLSSVTLTLREGECWALLGANGSGKTTLLRTLRGEQWITSGRRRFFLGPDPGQPDESPIGARERIGLVSPELQQAYVRRDWDLTAEAVVRSGFTDEVWPPEAATPAQAARVGEVLAELSAAGLAGRSILELSSGEARRVLLARALVNRPRLLLLDEPCHGLDAPARAAFLALVTRVARGGTPVVLATHRHDELIPEITRVAVLHGGRVLAQGGREEVLRRHSGPRASQAVDGRPPLSPALSPPLPPALAPPLPGPLPVRGAREDRGLSLSLEGGGIRRGSSDDSPAALPSPAARGGTIPPASSSRSSTAT